MEAAEVVRTLKEMTLALQDRIGAEAEAAHICLRNQLQLCVQKPRFPRTRLAQPWCQREVVPEVIGALPLPEAAARHDADAGLFQELHAVEHVGGHVMGLWSRAELRVHSWLCTNIPLGTEAKDSGNSRF